MITGRQLRAARALLRWNTKDLASNAGVGIQSVHRAESVAGVPNMQAHTLARLHGAVTAAGVDLIDGEYTGTGGPGARLRQ